MRLSHPYRCARSRRTVRKGIALVWTAVVLIVMIGMMGLSIDWGWVALDASQLHNAADAAALAGAMKLKLAYHEGNTDTAYSEARDLAMANYAAGDQVDLHYNAATNDPTLVVHDNCL